VNDGGSIIVSGELYTNNQRVLKNMVYLRKRYHIELKVEVDLEILK
jgi:hypothetical protein